MPVLQYKRPGDNDEVVEIHFSNSFYEFLLGAGSEKNKAPAEVRALFINLFTERTVADRTPCLVLRNDGLPTMDFFSIRRRGRDEAEPVVSFMPYGHEQVINENKDWPRKGRQTMRPGRWLNGLIKADMLARFNVTDKVKERFSNEVRIWSDNTAEVKIVSGEEILRFYGRDSMASDRGALGNSCMIYYGRPPEHRFSVYTDNPNCAMLVALDKAGKLIARAILWLNCDCVIYDGVEYGKIYSSYDTPTYKGCRIERHDMLDRIYAEDTWVIALMEQFATANGIWYKDGYKGGNYKTPNGKSEQVNFRVPMGPDIHTAWPYFDTMRYHDTSTDVRGKVDKTRYLYNNIATAFYAAYNTVPKEAPKEVPKPEPKNEMPSLVGIMNRMYGARDERGRFARKVREDVPGDVPPLEVPGLDWPPGAAQAAQAVDGGWVANYAEVNAEYNGIRVNVNR